MTTKLVVLDNNNDIFCYVCMFAFVACFPFSVLNQKTGWEERLRNDLFCVGWDVQLQLNQWKRVHSNQTSDVWSVNVTHKKQLYITLYTHI